MGAPYFQVKDPLRKHNVTLFSSNFSLYRNISRRVMSIVTTHSDAVQIYSVDEAFFTLSGTADDARESARELKKKLERATGIPVSIGIAKTKTLAKLANDHAKKNDAEHGVFCVDENSREDFLKNSAVSTIWGIGGKTALKLRQKNVVTALDLATADTQWIRSALGLHTTRTLLELRGTSCFSLTEHAAEKKGIICSRSFGKSTDDRGEVLKALSLHVHNAARKLRKQGHAALYIRVSIRTSRHKAHQKHISGFRQLLSPTSDTFELLRHAEDILREIFLPDFHYAKAGVSLSDFSPSESVPSYSLFYESDHAKHKQVMSLLDTVTKKLGPDALYPAALGTRRETEPKSGARSPDYTGSWHTIPVVRA